VDHFTENNGSLRSLVRGSPSVHEQDIIIGATWAKITSLGTLAWFDSVYSAAIPWMVCGSGVIFRFLLKRFESCVAGLGLSSLV